MQHSLARQRRSLHAPTSYTLACCFALSLAAAPSHAAPKARHRAKSSKAKSSAVSPPVQPHKGLVPNFATNDVDSYHIDYVRPDKKKPTAVVISMHLDAYEGMTPGDGFFQKQTPQGIVFVKWQRGWRQLDGMDEYGRSFPSENNSILVYTLAVDSPKALSVQLKTQQYSLYAMYLNGRIINKEAYVSGLSGDVDNRSPYDSQHFTYTFPGGHNVLTLQMDYIHLNE